MGIGSGVLKALASAFSAFNALISLKIEDAKAVEGIAWSIRKRFSIAASGVLDVVIDPTSFTGNVMVLQPLAFDSIGGPFTVDIYRGTDANNDGTLLQPFNRNMNIAGPGEVILRSGPIINAPGTLFAELLLPSNGTGVANASGEASEDSIILVLKTTEKYLVRITNTDGSSAGTIAMKTDHFEVA